MAYTHADGRIVKEITGKMLMLASEAVKAGDLVAQSLTSGAGVTLAIAGPTTATTLITTAATHVACEDIALGAQGWCALAVEIQDPPTVAAGGVWTKGSLVAASTEIGEPLYLSPTAGEATSVAQVASSALIKQFVGYVLDTDRIILAPLMSKVAPTNT